MDELPAPQCGVGNVGAMEPGAEVGIELDHPFRSRLVPTRLSV